MVLPCNRDIVLHHSLRNIWCIPLKLQAQASQVSCQRWCSPRLILHFSLDTQYHITELKLLFSHVYTIGIFASILAFQNWHDREIYNILNVNTVRKFLCPSLDNLNILSFFILKYHANVVGWSVGSVNLNGIDQIFFHLLAIFWAAFRLYFEL